MRVNHSMCAHIDVLCTHIVYAQQGQGGCCVWPGTGRVCLACYNMCRSNLTYLTNTPPPERTPQTNHLLPHTHTKRRRPPPARALIMSHGHHSAHCTHTHTFLVYTHLQATPRRQSFTDIYWLNKKPQNRERVYGSAAI